MCRLGKPDRLPRPTGWAIWAGCLCAALRGNPQPVARARR